MAADSACAPDRVRELDPLPRDPVRTTTLASNRLSVPATERTVRLSDTALLTSGLGIALFGLLHLTWPDGSEVMLGAGLGSLTTLLLLCRSRAHTIVALASFAQQLTLCAMALFGGLVVLLCCLMFLQVDGFEPGRVAIVWLAPVAALLVTSRLFICPLVRRGMASGVLSRRVAVTGARDLVRDFAARATTRLDTHVTGAFEFTSELRDATLLAHAAEVLDHCRSHRVDTIVIAMPLSEADRIAVFGRALGPAVADIYLAATLDAGQGAKGLAELSEDSMLLVRGRPISHGGALQKRVFDLVAGSLLLVALLPPMALIALAIRLDSGGPVLFRQQRLGFDNLPFSILKFRTMHHHMTDPLADQQATRGDARVTRVGRWLRKLSLDELPQLFNVLSGSMSLVGPRPHAFNTKAGGHRFTDVVAGYALRHRVKPGITGWAQVNGWRGETKTVEQIENRVAHDLHYIENWSLMLDAKIIFLTALREIVSSRAY